MIEIVRRTSRNVKRWQSGDMCLHWTARRHATSTVTRPRRCCSRSPEKIRHGPPPKIHGARDILDETG